MKLTRLRSLPVAPGMMVEGGLLPRGDMFEWAQQLPGAPSDWARTCDHCTMSPDRWVRPKFWRGLIDLTPACDNHDWAYALGRLMMPFLRTSTTSNGWGTNPFWQSHKDMSDNRFYFDTWWILRKAGWNEGYCSWFAGRRFIAVQLFGASAMTGEQWK